MPPTEAICKQRREQILEAALTIFTHSGIDHARMEDIAEEAGLSKGTLYLYFESKDDLIHSLLEQLSEAYGQPVQAIAGDEGPVIERLYALAHAMVDYTEQLTEIWPVIYESYAWALREEEIRRMMQRHFDASRTLLEDLIRKGIQQGEFRRVDPAETALQLVALHEGLQQLRALYGETTDWRATMLHAVALIVAALKPHPATEE